MIQTVALDAAIHCGEAADLDFAQLYEVQADLAHAHPTHRRSWELLTDEQRTAVIHAGEMFERETAESEHEAGLFLRQLRIEPKRNVVNGWRDKANQVAASHSGTRRHKGSARPPTDGSISDFRPERSMTPRPSLITSSRLFNDFVPKLAAAQTPWERLIVWDALDQKLRKSGIPLTPATRVLVLEVRGRKTVTATLSPSQCRKQDPTAVTEALELLADGVSEHKVAAMTGVHRTTLRRIVSPMTH